MGVIPLKTDSLPKNEKINTKEDDIMGKKSTFQQFNYALENNFEEGIDKHSYQKDHDHKVDNKVFGYTSLNNLRDVAKNICNYLKESNIKINNLNDIKSEHLQGFLNSKQSAGRSQATLNNYSGAIRKLELCVNKTYKSVNWDFNSDLITPTSIKEDSTNRGASSVISREDYNKIIEYCKDNRSISGDTILLQNHVGVRVEELAQLKIKNIDLENNKINFTNTKGGRPITKDIPEDIKKIIEENMLDKNGNPKDLNSKLFDIKSGSINKQLGRIQNKLGLEKHSIHDLRRCLAQEFYDNCRENGDSKDVALLKTSQFLGHNNARERMMTKSYITIW